MGARRAYGGSPKTPAAARAAGRGRAPAKHARGGRAGRAGPRPGGDAGGAEREPLSPRKRAAKARRRAPAAAAADEVAEEGSGSDDEPAGPRKRAAVRRAAVSPEADAALQAAAGSGDGGDAGAAGEDERGVTDAARRKARPLCSCSLLRRTHVTHWLALTLALLARKARGRRLRLRACGAPAVAALACGARRCARNGAPGRSERGRPRVRRARRRAPANEHTLALFA